MSYFQKNLRYYSSNKKEGFSGLRNCQKGAIWAVKSHFTIYNSHALICLPTGAGKTALMMALSFELEAKRVLIITPHKLVRNQTALKFQELEVLKEVGAVSTRIRRLPRVKEVRTIRRDESCWYDLLNYDVVVATPQTVFPHEKSDVKEPPANFFDYSADAMGFDLVFIDEAHHSAATTWNRALKMFTGTRTILMTATPFRRDRKRIRAKPVYTYPISKAIKDGIYREVDFISVEESLDTSKRDQLLADRALVEFNKTIKKTPETGVLIKAKSIEDAKKLLKIYNQAGWKKLGLIHSKLSDSKNEEVIKKVQSGELYGFIAVQMGAEGLDIPKLRIAVLHEIPKTLPYTIQLIGRISRSNESEEGHATLIADAGLSDGTEVQELYHSDLGWSLILPKLFDNLINKSKYLKSRKDLQGKLNGISLDELNPFYSIKVYKKISPSPLQMWSIWDQDEIEKVGEDVEVDLFEIVNDTAIAITHTYDQPAWTTNRELETERYDLHIFHFNRSFLFEYTTSETIASKLRKKVLNHKLYELADYYTLRKVLSDAKGGNFFTVGLSNNLGTDRGNPKYKTYQGSEVQMAIRLADGRAYGAGHAIMKKDLETKGIAFNSSKIWSLKRGDVSEFLNWCKAISIQMSDTNETPIPDLENNLIETKEFEEFPDDEAILTITFENTLSFSTVFYFEIEGWMYENPLVKFVNYKVDDDFKGIKTTLVVMDVKTDNPKKEVPVTFRLQPTAKWEYQFNSGIEIKFDSNNDIQTLDLKDYFENHPPTIILRDGTSLRNNLQSIPKVRSTEFPSELITAKKWEKTDVRREARECRAGYEFNVHTKTIEYIKDDYSLQEDEDFLVCDDRAKEVADFVLIRNKKRQVVFFHCKYFIGNANKPGIAEKQLQELASQSIRTEIWIESKRIIPRLAERIKGRSEIIFPNHEDALLELENIEVNPSSWNYKVVIVQPGISRKKMLEAGNRPTPAEQLLNSLYDRIRVDYNSEFEVWCSK